MTVPQRHGDVVIVVAIHGGEVGLAVTVEVGEAETVRMGLPSVLHHDRGAWRGLKGAPAIPKHEDDVVAVVIGEGKVQIPVAVDVAESHLVGTLRNLERSV